MYKWKHRLKYWKNIAQKKGKSAHELFERGEYIALGELVHKKWFRRMEFENERHVDHPQFASKQWNQIIERVGKSMVGMHAAGVVHGHTHLGNFVVNKQGQVKVIDLSLARRVNPPMNKGDFLQKFAHDIYKPAELFSLFEAPIDHEGTLTPHVERVIQKWLALYRKKMRTFGVTAEEIISYSNPKKRK